MALHIYQMGRAPDGGLAGGRRRPLSVRPEWGRDACTGPHPGRQRDIFGQGIWDGRESLASSMQQYGTDAAAKGSAIASYRFMRML